MKIWEIYKRLLELNHSWARLSFCQKLIVTNIIKYWKGPYNFKCHIRAQCAPMIVLYMFIVVTIRPGVINTLSTSCSPELKNTDIVHIDTLRHCHTENIPYGSKTWYMMHVTSYMINDTLYMIHGAWCMIHDYGNGENMNIVISVIFWQWIKLSEISHA